ncbi:hypothetical protein [Jannaschia rubra]|uniref:hypothetical protein n=1 Tax=Jannaschia rubra TaxID=282197 RepID=UPI0024901532|nr:hypothetical protein [Jannaschia rubra]
METHDPRHTLKPFGDALWAADGGIVRVHHPGGSLPVSTRMVLVRLPCGGLWAWAPSN